MSAAYRHIGAADAVDEVIRTIEQRGTSGLVRELGKRAGEEQQRGSKDYSVGQSQLSSAMIPYSMDFTDAYTARLKELGATTGTASEYENQAIADVRAGIKSNEKLKTASDKVSAAMTALADASEHIGQAGAFHRSSCGLSISWIRMTRHRIPTLLTVFRCLLQCVPFRLGVRCARRPRSRASRLSARRNGCRPRAMPPIPPAWLTTRMPSAWTM
ncbi:MAG: hypothetical protein ACLSUZ_08365 [Bifidobacterium pseudocatenulatum]